jgi:hypothetical protein
MARRGRSQPGDKTVLDAVEAARRALEGLEEPAAMARAAAVGAAMNVLINLRDLKNGVGQIDVSGIIDGAKWVDPDPATLSDFVTRIQNLIYTLNSSNPIP